MLLLHHRADGNIMIEWSKTANLANWYSLTYEYADADVPPLLQVKVLSEQDLPHDLRLTIAGHALNEHAFLLRANDPNIRPHTRDAEMEPELNNISPAAGAFLADGGEDGYAATTVTIDW